MIEMGHLAKQIYTIPILQKDFNNIRMKKI